MNQFTLQLMKRCYEVFSETDRAVGALPAELEGKTPLEIAQYYQSRERDLVIRQATGPVTMSAPPPPPRVTAEDFTNDPMSATQSMITNQTVSKDEFNRLTNAAQQNMLATAKLIAKEGKEHWFRLLPQMEAIAATTDPLMLIAPGWWETTYNYCVGKNLQILRTEEADRLRVAASNEGSSGPAAPAVTPRDLNQTEVQVAAGLGISHETWRTMETKMRDGRFPVTLDNRRIA